jgi:hypothetical protein
MTPPELVLKVARLLPGWARAPLRALWIWAHEQRPKVDSSGFKRRLRRYKAAQQPGLLSFITTVWNTPPEYLNALAKSVFTQQGGTEFEWFILDNGTHDPACLEAMRKIASHPCVRLERVDKNLGIIGGMRYCLERARGRYVLPLDSDDLLSPDCVRIMTALIVENSYPALLYSDEDKLLGELHNTPYYKPDWDPVLFLHSCYIAHLCAIDREQALALGCYTDPACEGSHDWDSFTRFHLAGQKPVHVPEIIYSWRMHENSTSSNIGSKPVVYASHQAVLGRFLSGAPDPARFEVVQSPLFGGAPDWRLRRRPDPECAPPLTTVVITESRQTTFGISAGDYPQHQIIVLPRMRGLKGLAEVLEGVTGLVHLLSEDVRVDDEDWAWEALGLMELFPDTVVVGGRALDGDGLVLSAGGFFGFGRGCDSPDRHRPAHDPGYFATLWKPHTVSTIGVDHTVFRADFLRSLLEQLAGREDCTLAFLGAWAGAAARRQDARIVYTPFLLALDACDREAAVSDTELADFILANADLIPDTKLMSSHLGLWAAAPFQPASPRERDDTCRALIAWAESARPH